MLLDRGATIPIPHDVKCSCNDCVIGSTDDSLKFSLARINAYRSADHIYFLCRNLLTSKDVILDHLKIINAGL
jgi:hypothetical protein